MSYKTSFIKALFEPFVFLSLLALVFFAFTGSANAAITKFDILSPNGGEYIRGVYTIKWDCQDNGVTPKCSDTTISNIVYSTDGGASYTETAVDDNTGSPYVANSLSASVGSFSWRTTANTESNQGRIKVIMNVTSGPNGDNDESDANFTVDNTNPNIQSVVTKDNDGNGKIDQIIVTFNEAMDQSKTSTSGFTYGTYTLASSGTWNSDSEFVINVTENANTCNYSDQSGCDTDDTSSITYDSTQGVLTDLAGNELNNFAGNVTDGAKPAIVGAKTIDFDSNGKLDKIYVQFSEDLNGTTVSGADFDVTANSSSYTINTASETVQGFVEIELQEGADYDTGVTPDVRISQGGMIKDLNGNELTDSDPGSQITAVDGAAPVAISSYYFNDTNNGNTTANVSQFKVVFSEPIVGIVGSKADLLPDVTITENDLSGLGNNVSDVAVNNTNEVLFAASGQAVNKTGVGSSGTEPTWDYTYDGTNGLKDDAGNVWAVSLNSAKTMQDKAVPLVVAATTINSDTDGTAETLELAFSEPIDDSSIVASDWKMKPAGLINYDSFDSLGTNTTILGGGTSTSNDEYVSLKINNPTNVSGTGVMQYSYTQGAAADHHGNKLEDIQDKDAQDDAAPKIVMFTYLDDDANGKIDTINAYFSEHIDHNSSNSTLSPNDLEFTNVGDFTGASFGVSTMNSVVGSKYAILRLGTEASVMDTRDDSGNLSVKVKSGQSPSLQDQVGNISTGADIIASDVKYVDEANPIIKEAKTNTGNGQGQTTYAYVKYTEDVSGSSTDTARYKFINKTTGAEVNLLSVSVDPNNSDTLVFALDPNDPDNYTGEFKFELISYQNSSPVVDKEGLDALQTQYDLEDLVSPVLVGFVATPNPAGVGDNLNFTLTFSEPMDTSANLSGTQFDKNPSSGPYSVTGSFNSTNTDKWEGSFDGNPVTVGNPESGTHTFSASWGSAKDLNGNTALGVASGVNLDFNIDSRYPQTTGLEVTPASSGLNIPVEVTATVNDDLEPQGANLYIELNGTLVAGPIPMAESNVTNGGKTKTYQITIIPQLLNLSAGKVYNLYVRGKDSANIEPVDIDGDGIHDIKTETLSISSDTTAPVVSIVGEGTTVTVDADTYTIEGSVTDTNFKTVKVFKMIGNAPSSNDVQVGFYAFGPSETNWQVTVPLEQNATQKFYAEAHDLNLNSAVSGILTINEQSDNTAPQISNVQVVNIGKNSATITWTTDENATSEVEYGLDANYGHKSATDATADNTNHSVTISTGLSCGTEYHYRVISKDTNGNVATSADATFTTSACDPADQTPPSITITSVTQGNTDISVDFSSTEAGRARINYGVATANEHVSSWRTMSAGSNSMSITGLACGTTYKFVIEAEDAVGNSSFTQEQTVSTNACADTTAPSVVSTTPTTGAVNVSVSAGAVTVKFDEGITIADQTKIKLVKVSDGSSVKNGNATVAGDTLSIPYNTLEYGTAYKVMLEAGAVQDNAGNATTLDTVVYFTTQDIAAPVITQLYVDNITSTSAVINWGTDVAVDSVEYKVSTQAYGGSYTSVVANTNSGTINITGINPSTTYYYTVRFIKNGKVAESVPVAFKTASADTGISVDSIQAVKTYAIADDTYANGWKWVFYITINDMAETNLAMKFDQWVNGTNTLDAANNMRYSIDGSNWVDITANSSYGNTIDVSAVDLDASRGGRQVKVYVEMKVPAGTVGGSYSTSYGIQTN